MKRKRQFDNEFPVNALNRIRGWFPQEPLLTNVKSYSAAQPQTKAELGRRAFKVASIANAILVNIFLGVNFLVLRPIYHYYMSLELSVLAFSLLAVALVAVNLVIYRHYKTRFLPKMNQSEETFAENS